MGDIKFAHINEMAGDGGGSGHDRADQMRAAVFALTAFEIAVAGAGAALVGRKNVRVHANAHAAARVAPLETCLGKDLVEALFFRLRFDAARTRHNQRLLDVLRNMLASYEMRRSAQIVKPRI